MKWPWNAPDTTPEPEEPVSETMKTRLQRLEGEVLDLATDVEILLRTVPKINARLRERAKRASDNEVEPELVAEETRPTLVGPPTKDEMRAAARQRGLMR